MIGAAQHWFVSQGLEGRHREVGNKSWCQGHTDTLLQATGTVSCLNRDNSHNIALWEDELNSRGQDGFRRTHLETNNCEISDLEGSKEPISDE